MNPSFETQAIQLCESVGQFSEAAMRRAILEARHPEKARRLMERLRRELVDEIDDFIGMALCVILSEARIEAAIPLLLKAATRREESPVRDAAAYGLCRMGPPALRATMRWIERSCRPWVRVLGYEILQAAVDAGEETRDEVADYCLARAEIETARAWPEDDWDPAAAVCDTLVVFRDERVRPFLDAQRILARSSGACIMWVDMIADLEAGRRWIVAPEWRTDWPETCRDWAHLLEHAARE